jgi:hypothetical protein
MRCIMKKPYAQPTRCPICSGKLIVTQVACEECGVAIQGHFTPNRFAQLDEEQLQFLEVFPAQSGHAGGRGA